MPAITRLPRRPFAYNVFPTLAREFDQLQTNIRRMLENPMDTFSTTAQPIGWVPPVEISETPEAIVLTAELPGLSLDDVAVEIDNDVLTVKGEKSNEFVNEDAKFYLVERSYGTFSRSFTLPNTVNADAIAAAFDNGILTITMPKTVAAKARGKSVPITAGAPMKAPAPTPRPEVKSAMKEPMATK